ncbi:type I-E CRISPR-associated protein Cse2/CasB [Enterobacteriaceae bacterium LUAb1]
MRKRREAMVLYKAWYDLDRGNKAVLRRAATPEALLEIPSFYMLISPFGWPRHASAWLKMVFCLTSDTITHSDDPSLSLGYSLAKNGNVNSHRLLQLLRLEEPDDIVQLRRLLTHTKPTLHWPSLAKQLQGWGKDERRALLEDFVVSALQMNKRVRIPNE